MRGVQTNCPACGGPVRFRLSSALVTVCEYCRTVVARTDRKIEDLGKVAAIVETASPLHVGLQGTFRGKRFAVMGRAQLHHAAGGTWDEWYVAFPSNRWGWLAESQGKFHLTFARELPEDVALPAFESLTAGERVTVGDETFVVGEVGEAETAGAEGEMPFVLHPGEAHRYADLHGEKRRFVTLDYAGKRPTVFAGQEVTLAELGLADAVAPEKELKRVAGAQLNCPQCGGTLSLVAPDQALRVVCPHCKSLLDADQGKLSYLQTLTIGEPSLLISIGATGELGGVKYTNIGFVRRSVTYSGKDYYWSEYLLYEPKVGFRWLIHSDGHWSFGEPASPGDVRVEPRDAYVSGERFRLFQQAAATVRYVLGEFYWKVELGETVRTRDFVSPPRMLTIEDSATLQRRGRKNKKKQAAEAEAAAESTPTMVSETNYTLSTYVPHEVVEQAFKLKDLRRGFGVAPNQPGPVDGRVYRWWAGYLAAIAAAFGVAAWRKTGIDMGVALGAAGLVSVIPIGALLYARSFEVSRWSESDYSPYPSGDGDDDEGGGWGDDDD